MKKEKKSKKSNVKNSKKKKNNSEKKSAISKNSVPTPEITSPQNIKSSIETTDLFALMSQAMETYQSIITAPRIFIINGEPCPLFPSELKTLEVIGSLSGINLTQLSLEMDVSKSAISKCTGKMLEKSLIHKKPSPTNVRQVQFTLSEEGKIVYDQYLKLQHEQFDPLYSAFDSLDEKDLLKMYDFFSDIEKELSTIQSNQKTPE